MPDALVAVDDGRLAADHGEHVALRADGGAGAAANALRGVYVRVLGPGPIGEQQTLFGRRTGFSVAYLEAPHVENQRDPDYRRAEQCGRPRLIHLAYAPSSSSVPDQLQKNPNSVTTVICKIASNAKDRLHGLWTTCHSSNNGFILDRNTMLFASWACCLVAANTRLNSA